MSRWRRLTTRLFVSYAAVAAVGAVVLLVTVRVLVPRLFDDRMGAGAGPGGAGRGPGMHDALVAALDRALLIALLTSLAIAGFLAVVIARRIVRPINRVRTAARRLAAGHYDERIEPPTEPELAALAADVNALARSLADTEQRRADLVSDVAHELRTPLTTIRGYAEGIVDGVIAPDHDILAAVLAEVDRLQHLADDLSTLSHADSRPVTKQELTDLHEIASTVVTLFGPRASAKGIDLRLAGPSAPLRGDHDRLVQVLTNLVANALTYTPPGGHIAVDVTTRGSTVECAVSDTGVGLEPDDVERIFERFYRVRGVDRPPGGSGIGLAIARAITRAHGGDITATSAGPGAGATFTVTLPAAIEPAAA
jgi:histidine kinase